MAAAAGVLLVLVLLGIVIVGPIVAIVTLSRLRHLERRVASLEAATGRSPQSSPVSAGPVTSATLPVPADSMPSVERTTPVPALASANSTPADAGAAAAPTAPTAGDTTGFDWEGLVAGRWLNRVGLLAVAIGVSYFLKYAIDNAWIGPRGQVAAGVLAGAALVAWSPALVKRGLTYFADGIAGLGAAILYLALWAAAIYYELLSPPLAFGAMVIVTASMLALAIGRSSQRLAVLAMIGGFLTPALVSTGRDAHVALFLYLAAHNTALLVLVAYRNWRFIELPAFFFTQAYFWIWYDTHYSDTLIVRTTAFAALFFAQFSALPLVRVRRAIGLRLEQSLLALLNTGVFLLVLHSLFWPEARWTLTIGVIGLAVVHLLIARVVPPAEVQTRVVFAGLALTLATLVIPIRLDGQWIAVAWAVEAAVLALTGFAFDLWRLRAAAYAIFAGVVLFVVADPPAATTFLWNARFATALVVVASMTAVAWRARAARLVGGSPETVVLGVMAVTANVVLIGALTLEVWQYFLDDPQALTTSDRRFAYSLSISLLWTVYATMLVVAGARLRSALLRWQGLALFGITTLKVFFSDLGYLDGIYRIASSIALGVVLLIVSFLYQRATAARGTGDEGAM